MLIRYWSSYLCSSDLTQKHCRCCCRCIYRRLACELAIQSSHQSSYLLFPISVLRVQRLSILNLSLSFKPSLKRSLKCMSLQQRSQINRVAASLLVPHKTSTFSSSQYNLKLSLLHLRVEPQQRCLHFIWLPCFEVRYAPHTHQVE